MAPCVPTHDIITRYSLSVKCSKQSSRSIAQLFLPVILLTCQECAAVIKKFQ